MHLNIGKLIAGLSSVPWAFFSITKPLKFTGKTASWR
jgi:hypothetical protein